MVVITIMYKRYRNIGIQVGKYIIGMIMQVLHTEIYEY